MSDYVMADMEKAYKEYPVLRARVKELEAENKQLKVDLTNSRNGWLTSIEERTASNNEFSSKLWKRMSEHLSTEVSK